MKKIALILTVIIVVFLGALTTIPLFFKQNLLDAAKTTINKQVNADFNFGGVKLSLLKNFPKLSMELQNVKITGKGEFQNDTLLYVASLQTKMDIKALFGKTEKNIENIYLIQPDLKLVVDKTGTVNWDIVKKTTDVSGKQTPSETENIFKIRLDKIEISNASIWYIDHESNMLLGFENISADVNGKMYGTAAELNITGKIDRFSIEYKGIKYLNTSLETKTMLDIDYKTMDIVIKENELLVNRLPLQVSGSIKIPSDSMYFDLAMQTKESGFENFMALIPPNYETYLKNFKATGTTTVSGTISGLYYEDNYPAFALALKVSDGNFKYAGLSDDIRNIKADVSITKPQGNMDLTEVKITEAHAEVKNNNVNLSLLLKNIVSDPYFDGTFAGKINFDHLKDAIPLDSINIAGTIDANLLVKGNYSSIEKEQYDKIQSDGIVFLDNFIYESASLTQPVFVKSGKLDLSPQNINLSQLNMNIGRSDFNLNGKVSNYLNYIFKDGILKGDLQLNSNYVNVNELLRLQVEKPDTAFAIQNTATNSGNIQAEKEVESLAFDIPQNVDFVFRSKISRANFDRIDISDINGLITAKEGKLMLDGLNMNMLDGELKLTGSYQNTPENQPLFDFGFDVVKIDIPQAFQTIAGLQKIVPVAGLSSGKVSTSIKMKGRLTNDFKLVPTSINGNGLFNTENLQILNSEVFSQFKEIIKSEKLSNVSVDDFKANFTIQEGNLLLSPFVTKISGQETRIAGSLNTQNFLDMQLDFNIQRDAFGTDIQNILSVIPGNQNITLVPVGVKIIGPVEKPEIKMDLSETRQVLLNATKDELQKGINRIGEELRKLLN